MSDTYIRHTRRSKHYMAPVLLDHRSQRKLVITMVLVLVVIFLCGYVMGFKKAEVKLASHVDTVALALAKPVEGTAADIEPQRPMLPEPGETIDVDRVDDEQVASVNGIINLAQAAQSETSEKLSQTAMKKTVLIADQTAEQNDVEEKQAQLTVASHPMGIGVPIGGPIGGPAQSDPGQGTVQLIQDNATEDSATYSIQVGMYGQLENAEQKVEELIANDLSAYLTDYTNKKNEIRYNVRFGYFADRKSARQALATYEKELSGSGYIVRLEPEASATTGS